MNKQYLALGFITVLLAACGAVLLFYEEPEDVGITIELFVGGLLLLLCLLLYTFTGAFRQSGDDFFDDEDLL
jgi:hypothetical protein